VVISHRLGATVPKPSWSNPSLIPAAEPMTAATALVGRLPASYFDLKNR